MEPTPPGAPAGDEADAGTHDEDGRYRRPGDGRVLFTIGAGEASVDEVIDTLRGAGVSMLVDIRDRAAGRRGFNRAGLEAACEQAGLAYTQVRDLGAPVALRRSFDPESDGEAFRAAYRDHIRTHKDAFVILRQHVVEGPTALFCRCAHPALCERGVVAGLFLRAGYGVRHLVPSPSG